VLAEAALAATPAHNLVTVKAAALREAARILNSNVIGDGDYYSGMEAGIESAKNTLEAMADDLERAAKGEPSLWGAE
jgi:hypothetical protein